MLDIVCQCIMLANREIEGKVFLSIVPGMQYAANKSTTSLEPIAEMS